VHSPTPPSSPPSPPNFHAVIGQINQQIEAFIASRGFPDNLSRGITYAVLAGGKRLRPALAWYSSIACHGTGSDSLDAGMAVELIHAFSLVHDDLPALDNDDLRRGRPTLHRQTSEAMAILAGDAMLSLAYEAVLESKDTSIIQRLSVELARGTRAMIIGQVYDTLGGLPSEADPEAMLQLIHRNKTGALLTAACRMGAICAHASDRQLDLITRYAQAIGLQFQIVDDLLDVEGSSQEVGKALGKDAQAGKLTYPGVLGVQRSREIVDDLARAGSDAIDELGSCTEGTVEPLRQLGSILTTRTQ